MFCSHSTNRSCGTLVVVPDDLEFQLKSQSIDCEGRRVHLDANVKVHISCLLTLTHRTMLKSEVCFSVN